MFFCLSNPWPTASHAPWWVPEGDSRTRVISAATLSRNHRPRRSQNKAGLSQGKQHHRQVQLSNVGLTWLPHAAVSKHLPQNCEVPGIHPVGKGWGESLLSRVWISSSPDAARKRKPEENVSGNCRKGFTRNTSITSKHPDQRYLASRSWLHRASWMQLPCQTPSVTSCGNHVLDLVLQALLPPNWNAPCVANVTHFMGKTEKGTLLFASAAVCLPRREIQSSGKAHW